jgi:multidrug efflux system membrane fusion protein
VTLGPTEGDKVTVLEGLQPNEVVVVDGADKLREGMKVKLITREPAPSPEETPSLPGNKINQDKDKKSGN